MFLKSNTGEFVNLSYVYAAKIYNNDIDVGSFRLYTAKGSVLFEFETQSAFEEAIEQLELLMPAKADLVKVDNHWFRADHIQCVKEFGMELQVRMTNEEFQLIAMDIVELEYYKELIEKALTSSYALETLPMQA